MEVLITLGIGLSVLAGIVCAVFLGACVHAFCSNHGDPWWMKTIGGVTTLVIVALIAGALVRFS